MTMRTRLCCAIAKMEMVERGVPLEIIGPVIDSAPDVAVEAFGSTVDAVLAELRNPSVEMRHVCTFEVAETVFPAMIDAARAK